MALNPDIIKANQELAGLTESQITAIATLSQNDEETVIASKIGELHGRYDQDVKAVTGIDKVTGEKSYDYVKRVLGEYKTQVGSASELTSKIATYEKEINTLKTTIAEGKGDEIIRQQLRDAQSELNTLKGQYETERQSWTAKEKEFNENISKIQIETQFEKTISGLKFKPEYPKEIQSTLINSAKTEILRKYKPEWSETNGQKVMIFRDEKGEIVRNTANLSQPYTVSELITEQLKSVLDSKPGQGGAGSQKTILDSGALDLSGALDQIEADEMISKYLLKSGELRGTASFAEKQKKIRIELGVDKLPLRKSNN